MKETKQHTETVKIQIRIPKEEYDLIQKEIEGSYIKTSAWFLKAARFLINNSKENKPRKMIDLDI
ncbi:MAG: hypothetical protein KA477_00065 [Candidatus Levybacteria bacterium]|jgi:hypothetical protein|nr:hypothetical protein [Candidatus Levybacteria bacterium]